MYYREYNKLDNGQVAMLHAHRAWNENGDEGWSVTVVIGKHRKQCRLSVRGEYARYRGGKSLHGKSTGTCGIAGLRTLKAMLGEFEAWLSTDGKTHQVVCTPFDDKRKRAYRYLMRLGYVWYEDVYSYRKHMT